MNSTTREEKEKWLISILLFDETNLNCESLTPSIFKNDKYKTIFQALDTIYKSNPQQCNTITLINYLKIIDKLNYVGGECELVNLQTEIPDITTRKKIINTIKYLRANHDTRI